MVRETADGPDGEWGVTSASLGHQTSASLGHQTSAPSTPSAGSGVGSGVYWL